MNSEIYKLFATILFGGILYFIYKRTQNLLLIIGYILSFGILASFVFNIGEVYSYSPIYKRAFFTFSDNITTIIILIFSYAILRENKILSALSSSAIFMSGGKISILLLPFLIIFLVKVNIENIKLLKRFFQYILIGILIYFSILSLTGIIHQTKIYKWVQSASFITSMGKNRVGSACKNLSSCFETQVSNSIQQRYFTSLGGLWMTLQGGYRGTAATSTPDGFANLMMQENPWGINDKYALELEDWKKMGAVQNPYLRFGGVAGPWFLIILLLGLFVIGYLGVCNIRAGESGFATVFTCYFIVIIILNQTQPWIIGGSNILLALSFCGFHIINSWLSRNPRFSRYFHSIDWQ